MLRLTGFLAQMQNVAWLSKPTPQDEFHPDPTDTQELQTYVVGLAKSKFIPAEIVLALSIIFFFFFILWCASSGSKTSLRKMASGKSRGLLSVWGVCCTSLLGTGVTFEQYQELPSVRVAVETLALHLAMILSLQNQ